MQMRCEPHRGSLVDSKITIPIAPYANEHANNDKLNRTLSLIIFHEIEEFQKPQRFIVDEENEEEGWIPFTIVKDGEGLAVQFVMCDADRHFNSHSFEKLRKQAEKALSNRMTLVIGQWHNYKAFMALEKEGFC